VASNDDKPVENIFRAMDEIVYQLNKTKRLFILMIISFVVIVPLTHVITFLVLGETTFGDGRFDGRGPPFDRGGPPDNPSFRVVQAVVLITVLVWIGIGIRQWFLLSSWTKKYNRYKELQKKVDEKLDYDEDNDEKDS
jgi:NADH:ubiquinone oxidoreductase subunit 5 (subunit L)/multisubunit Na+/H+ antiporter MnhA subunit